MKVARFVAGALTAAALAVATMGPGAARAQSITFASGIQVQNLSSSQANISIAFYKLRDGTPAHQVEATVPANGQQVYATLPSAVQAGFDGSAVISSDQRIAATVNIVSPDLSLSFGGETYVGMTEGSQSVSVPLLFKKVAGFNTFVAVQNIGSTATNIEITYQNGKKETFNNLAPGASTRFDQGAVADTILPAGFVGAATITSSASDIAAVVTQVGPTTMLIYNGFAAGAENPVFPLINANNGGFITGVAIQNAGTTDTNVTVSYTPSINPSTGRAEGTACTETLTIPAKGSKNFAVDAFAKSVTGENCANGALFVGSGRVTTNSANQPLVAIVNQLNSRTNKGGSYAAFDSASASNTVVYPLIQDLNTANGPFFTGIAVYNAGTVDTDVTCTFTGQTAQQKRTALKPGQTFSITQLGVFGGAYTGSGTCTAAATGAKIVGTANQVRVQGSQDTFFVYEGITK